MNSNGNSERSSEQRMSRAGTESFKDGFQKAAFGNVVTRLGSGLGARALGIAGSLGSRAAGAATTVGSRIGNTVGAQAIKGGFQQGVGEGLKQTAKHTGRYIAGVKPGDAAFSKARHYVTRPLRAVLAPNIGKPLNATRAVAGGGYLSYQGIEGYKTLGDVAENAKVLARDATLTGQTDLAERLRSYDSRGGILKSLLRGNRVTGGIFDSGDSLQRSMDRVVAEGVLETTRNKMLGATSSAVKPHEILNPIGATLIRKGVEAGGEEFKPTHFRDKVREIMDDYQLDKFKETVDGKFSATIDPVRAALRRYSGAATKAMPGNRPGSEVAEV